MITLATLSKSTAQEVFDQVVNHAAKQMEQSEEASSGTCAYRQTGSKGQQVACFGGCLMADEEYKPEWDSEEHGVTWTKLVRHHGVTPKHEELITELQDIHDFSQPRHWRAKLEYTAWSHNLTFTWPDDAQET